MIHCSRREDQRDDYNSPGAMDRSVLSAVPGARVLSIIGGEQTRPTFSYGAFYFDKIPERTEGEK